MAYYDDVDRPRWKLRQPYDLRFYRNEKPCERLRQTKSRGNRRLEAAHGDTGKQSGVRWTGSDDLSPSNSPDLT
ncbi:Hypothetical predicted protein, partial [Pelobates cultripes]